MKSQWKVTSNYISDKKIYGVFRVIDPNEVDHSGNREVLAYYETKEEAETICKKLNKEK